MDLEMSSISESAYIGVPNYDLFVSDTYEGLTFRDKTLSEWESIVEFGTLDETMDSHDLKAYNYSYMEKTMIIMNNLAYAKSSLKACEMHYEVQISHAKIKFVNEYKEKHSSSRLPSAEIINNIVNNSCAESYIAKNLAEIFLAFWQSQYDKVKIIDSRLSGLGYLIGIESKNSHN